MVFLLTGRITLTGDFLAGLVGMLAAIFFVVVNIFRIFRKFLLKPEKDFADELASTVSWSFPSFTFPFVWCIVICFFIPPTVWNSQEQYVHLWSPPPWDLFLCELRFFRITIKLHLAHCTLPPTLQKFQSSLCALKIIVNSV